jgi:hypothetical protein
VPSLKPGTHKLTLVLDTKTPFGVLTAERTVKIEDPIIGKLQTAYKTARDAGNDFLARTACKKLIATRFSNRIKPGQAYSIDKPNTMDTVAPEGFAVRITWYPEKDLLRAVVNAADPGYAACQDRDKRRNRGFVRLFVCPSGADQDIYQIYAAEGEKDGVAFVGAGQGERISEPGEGVPVKASWWRTPDGYKAEVRIPWSVLPGYQKEWAVMPVEAQVLSRTKGWSFFSMTKPGEPDTSARTYSLLTPK